MWAMGRVHVDIFFMLYTIIITRGISMYTKVESWFHEYIKYIIYHKINKQCCDDGHNAVHNMIMSTQTLLVVIASYVN